MKTIPHSLLCAALLSLLTAVPLFAAVPDRNPERRPSSSGWVSAPDASFHIRTHQDANGDLVVQVSNQSLRSLTILLQTLRGEEIAYVPVHRRQSQAGIKLDVRELADGDYRLIVATDNAQIVTLVNLTTPLPTPRQATVAVVRQALDR